VNYEQARIAMVETQIRARGIKDPRVLGAMKKVPRHEFVPAELRAGSYEDHPLPIGQGQTISQPYMVALMTELLRPDKNCIVLEIGTGSGYQAAILAELSKHVYTIERVPEISERALRLLKSLGYANVTTRTGDGSKGLPEFAPYERIIVTAGAPAVPPALTDELAPGGIMVIPEGDMFGQVLKVMEKDKQGNLKSRKVCGCVFAPLIGEGGWKK